MDNRFRRLMLPIVYCLAVACLVELPLMQTDRFGDEIILWDTLFRAAFSMPGLWYFYQKDHYLRGKPIWNRKTAWVLIAFAAASSLAFRLLFEQFGMPGYESVEEKLLTGNPYLQAVVLLAASPMLEEFFFRGILYERLKESCSVAVSAVISALAFGLYHANLSQGIYGFVMGLFFAWAMERYKTIKAPLLMHIAANFMALAVDKNW